MPKTTRLANRTVSPKPAEARPSTPAPSVTKPKKAEVAAAPVKAAAAPIAAPAKAAAPAPRAQAASALHFDVHPGLADIRGYAEGKGWIHNGTTQLSIAWQSLIYTTDGWKTANELKSSEVPSPVANGRFTLPGVPSGTEVEFAIHVGVASPGAEGDVWLNNGGQNFRQVTQ